MPTPPTANHGATAVAIGAFVVAVFGLWLFRSALVQRRRIREILNQGYFSPGVVVGFATPPDSQLPSYTRPIIRWTAEGGDVCAFEHRWGGNWLHLGQTVKVRWLPGNRAGFVVEECAPQRSVGLLFRSVTGAALGLLGAVAAGGMLRLAFR